MAEILGNWLMLKGIPLSSACKESACNAGDPCLIRGLGRSPEEGVQFSCSGMSDSLQWTVAHQASLFITNSRSLLKLMSFESVMPYDHLILCHPLLLLPSIFPSIRVFSKSQFFASGGQSIRGLASASVLPMNIQN